MTSETEGFGALAHHHGDSVSGVRAYFDAFADGEWERLETTVAGRVSFEVHRRFLERFISPGMRVLEVGAGPGRFTIELARLGARVVVTDLSPVQLQLNERYVARHGYSAAVESRQLADVCDLSAYRDGEFDAAVAFGGPLSYAFDRVDAAVAGLFRVVRSGGPLVASVMSTIGAYRQFLPGVIHIIETMGDDANDRVLSTGDLRETQPPGSGHTCKMFRWAEVEQLVTSAGGQVVAASASNWASLGDPEVLDRLAADPVHWSRFLDNEVRLCAEPGVWDGATHVMFAATRGQD